MSPYFVRKESMAKVNNINSGCLAWQNKIPGAAFLKWLTDITRMNSCPSLKIMLEVPLDTQIILEPEDDEKLSSILAQVMDKASDEVKIFLQSQIKGHSSGNKHPRSRRWDLQVISLCLSLYTRSPGAYKDLTSSGMVVLPSERLLRYYKNSVDQKPGINPDNILWMHKEAERQQIPETGRHGGLIIDEMAVQDDIQIVRRGDKWKLVGATDVGTTCNNIEIIIKDKKSVEMATHALQLVYHGLGGFRWPVVYYASSTAKAHELYQIIWDVVDKLKEYNFHVEYLMMDGASTNRAFVGIMLENPRDQKYTVQSPWDFNHNITIVQDIKHVLKKIRNGLESSKKINKSAEKGRCLLWNEYQIVWEHWEDALGFNYHNGIRVHRGLTNEHIHLTPANKMRNHLAIEVLNKDMLHLMTEMKQWPEDPTIYDGSIKLLEHTSIIVDIFSDSRPVTDVSDDRIKHLNSVLCFFNDWESAVTVDDSKNVTKHLLTQQTRDDLNSFILGFTSICNRLIPKNISVRPSFFNSDLVENLFCQQRGIRNGLNTKPTVAQYGPGLNAIVLGQTSVSSKCISSTKALPFKATTPVPLHNKKKRKSIRI